GGVGRELEQRAALEVHAVVQPAEQHRRQADQQDQPGDHVEDLPAADEVNRHLAAVQPPAEVAEPGHHASLGLVRGFAADVALPGAGLGAGRREPRHGDRAPSRAGSRPDSLWPWPKNLVLASSVTIGLVNRNTTMTSMSVVRPSV